VWPLFTPVDGSRVTRLEGDASQEQNVIKHTEMARGSHILGASFGASTTWRREIVEKDFLSASCDAMAQD